MRLAEHPGSPGMPLAPVGARPGNRIVLVDGLRGVCFAVMTVDHQQWNPLARFSNANYGLVGFFTAALGFVFLSGLIAGRVYRGELVLRGRDAMIRRVLRRMRALYLTQMLLFVVLVGAVGVHVRGFAEWHLDLFQSSPLKGLALSGTLLYEPGYLGILPMYLLFLLATPIVLLQFERGNVWRVLGSSAALWICSGLMIRLPADPNGVDFGAFNPFGYQFLFVVGLALGANQIDVDRLLAKVGTWLIPTAATLASVFLVLRLQYALGGPLTPLVDRLDPWFTSIQLGPLRVLDFAAFAVVLYWACRRIRWDEVESLPFRWLAFVGRHSLPVFGWSILVTYASVALLPSDPGAVVGLLTVAALTVSLTIPAQLHAVLMRRSQDGKRRLLGGGRPASTWAWAMPEGRTGRWRHARVGLELAPSETEEALGRLRGRPPGE